MKTYRADYTFTTQIKSGDLNVQVHGSGSFGFEAKDAVAAAAIRDAAVEEFRKGLGAYINCYRLSPSDYKGPSEPSAGAL